MAERGKGRRAPYPAGVKARLAPFNLGRAVQEVVSHAVLLLIAWYGGLGYLGTILVLVSEPLIVIALSIFLYPQRGLRRHLWDMVKSVAIMAFLLVFVFATSGGGYGDRRTSLEQLLRLEWSILAWALLYSALHLGGLMIYAATQPNPRKVWTALALTQGGVTFVALFCTIFVAAFIGSWLGPLVHFYWPRVQGGDVLVLLAVLVRLGFALLMSRIPADEMDRIADDPYLD